MSEEALERYRQRYETWRHLDRLRYVIVQVAVGGIAGLGALIESSDTKMPVWAWFALATFVFFQSKILSKINDGIEANGKALRDFGQEVGDDKLPDTSNRATSIFYYIEWALLLIAIICIVIGGVRIIGILAK
jgi:hypothetical protein